MNLYYLESQSSPLYFNDALSLLLNISTIFLPPKAVVWSMNFENYQLYIAIMNFEEAG